MDRPLPIYYYRKSERDSKECRDFLLRYDKQVKQHLPDNFPFPTRQRDWELFKVLQKIPTDNAKIKILDTGSFNTFTGFWLAAFTKVPSSLTFCRNVFLNPHFDTWDFCRERRTNYSTRNGDQY